MSVSLLQIQKSFSKAANSYDLHAALQRYCAQKLIASIPHEIAPQNILDIGCGTGILTELLGKKYPQSRLICLDLSHEMLLVCEKKFGTHNHIYQWGSAENKALIDQLVDSYHIDMIVSNLCLQWVHDPQDMIRYYQHKAPSFISLLCEETLSAWYQTVKYFYPEYKPPIRLLSAKKCTETFYYTLPYCNSLAFLRDQKKLGTFVSNDTQMSAGKLRQACYIYDQTYQSIIKYHVGLIGSLG